MKDLLYNPRSGTFMGYPIQQCWADLAIWERFFNQYKVASMVELGTGHCGMSLFFLLQCTQREINYTTVDIYENSKLAWTLAERLHLREHFSKTDVFAEEGRICRMLHEATKPLLLYCDNGDKPREVKTFVPELAPGDYVAVHDWGSEIKASDMDGLFLEPVMRDECEKWESITRFWRTR